MLLLRNFKEWNPLHSMLADVTLIGILPNQS